MRRCRKQAGRSLGRRAQRGAVAMGMMAQSGRRSARVSERDSPMEYGMPVCLDPNATNTYDGPMQGVELGALLFGGKDAGSNPCTRVPCSVYPDQSLCEYGPSQGLNASGRRSAFRGQTGDDDGIIGCTNPEAINFNANAMADDGSCLMLEDVCAMCPQTGGNDPVGADGIKPFEDPSTPPMGVRPFRKQTGDIPTCPSSYVGTHIPQPMEGFGVPILDPQLSGCGRCRCQTPDGPDCPDMYGQWLGGSPFNVEESTCNCDYQSDGCVNPTGGGLLDPSLSKPTFNKLPRLRGKMRGQSGKMSRASQTGSGHTMRCGTPAGGSSNFGWEYPEPTWGFTGCDYLFGTQSECQAQCTSGPSPMRDGMKNASGRDMCGFYSNPSDAPFTG